MSFDIDLVIPPCGHCDRGEEIIEVANVTHNVNDMVEVMFAGIGWDVKARNHDQYYNARSWGRLDGHIGDEVEPYLSKALEWFYEHEDELVPMNPPNGWGSTKCLERVLTSLIGAINSNPQQARIKVCG